MFGGLRCGTTHIWVVRRQTVKEVCLRNPFLVTISFAIPVRPSLWKNSAPTGEKSFDCTRTRITRTSHEDVCPFVAISSLFAFRTRIVSGEFVKEIRTLTLLAVTFPQISCRL